MLKTIPQHYFKKIGKKYYDITILDLKIQGPNVKIIYRCKCGKLNQCPYVKISKRCMQCYNKEGRRSKITHGMTRISEHTSWMSMKSRCKNLNNPSYHNYGGRGIKVCKRWLGENGFKNFLKDMGERPEPKKNYSIERINNNGNYQPSNCKWATQKEQLSNKRNNRVSAK